MIAPQPFFEPRGTPFSVLGRLKALSRLGHEVDLLTYHLGQDVAISGVAIHRTPNVRFIKAIRIGPSFRKLFLDALMLVKAFRMLKKNRYDLIHSHEEASFFGILLARLFKIRHLYDMHSSLPQQLSNFRYTRFRPIIRTFERLERWSINSSAAVITICPALDEYMRRINHRVPHMMIENVPLDEDGAAVSTDAVKRFREACSLDDQIVILYAGTFESYQGIDLLIDGAEKVVREIKDVVFVLIGGRPEQVRRYQDRVNAVGLGAQFRFTGTRPPAEIPAAITAAAVLVSPRISGTNTPLKIYSYLRSGKPIVATNLSTHTQVLDSKVAMLVEPDPAALAEGILALLRDPRLADQMGQRAQRHFRRCYSFEGFIRKTNEILESALG